MRLAQEEKALQKLFATPLQAHKKASGRVSKADLDKFFAPRKKKGKTQTQSNLAPLSPIPATTMPSSVAASIDFCQRIQAKLGNTAYVEK